MGPNRRGAGGIFGGALAGILAMGGLRMTGSVLGLPAAPRGKLPKAKPATTKAQRKAQKNGRKTARKKR